MYAAIDESLPESMAWASQAKKISAIEALIELVDGAAPGKPPREINTPAAWVHCAFDTYRSGMDDNDNGLHRLARIEHDFIAALEALNFDDQKRQLRRALLAVLAF